MKIVFDLDGTLCDTSAREMVAADLARNKDPEERKKIWDRFHDGIPHDLPVRAVKTTLRALALSEDERINIIELWTARPERYRVVTEAWLKKHRIPHDVLLMRGDNDYRPSPIVKLEWFFLSHPKPELVFEDHPETVRLLRMAGVTVANMGDGRAHV